jgi:probable blue pigment (indigoidine) exporter
LASENAIIVAMEPLMTAFMACVLLRENLSSSDLSAFSLALIGFSFLAGLTPQVFSTGMSDHLLGNLLILVSLTGEASYTVLARRLTAVYAPLGIFGSALLTGVFSLTLSISMWKGFFALFPEIHHFTWKTLLALILLGPIGTAGAYLYLMYVLVDLPVMSVTLFLFLQPLAGALWGYLFLGDKLSVIQLLGGGLILGAVLLPNWVRLKKRSTH